MGKLVESVERICRGCPSRGLGCPCPAIVQLAREIELLWERLKVLTDNAAR